jgi:hypothetical protein
MPQDSLGLQIEESLENFLPKHTDSEMDALRDAVLSDGRFTDSLLACKWNDRTVLVDGHGRYRLWLSLPEDTKIRPPRVEYLDLSTFDEARGWMAKHALGRRNLTKLQIKALVGARYNAAKRSPHRPIKKGGQSGHLSPLQSIKTEEKIAKEEKTSSRTVRRAGKFEDALRKIGAVNLRFPDAILANKYKLTEDQVISLGNLPEDKMRTAIATLESGKKWDSQKTRKAKPGSASPEDFKASIPESFRAVNKSIGECVKDVLKLQKRFGDSPSCEQTNRFLGQSLEELQRWQEQLLRA